jgi:hypothetical protein
VAVAAGALELARRLTTHGAHLSLAELALCDLSGVAVRPLERRDDLTPAQRDAHRDGPEGGDVVPGDGALADLLEPPPRAGLLAEIEHVLVREDLVGEVLDLAALHEARPAPARELERRVRAGLQRTHEVSKLHRWTASPKPGSNSA